MSALLDARPPAVNVPYRPGDPLTVVMNWPAGSLTGRTFTSTLGAASLSVSIVGDVMTTTATPAQTAAAAGVELWELIDTTPANDVTMIVGKWVASDDPSAAHDVTVPVTTASGTVAITLQGMSSVGDLTVAGTLVVGGQALTLLAAGDPTETTLTTVGDTTTLTLTDAMQRSTPIQSGHYFYNRMDGTSSNQTLTQDLLFLTDVMLWAGTIDRIGIQCVTQQAGSSVRLGIYSDNGGVPNARIAEASSTADTTTTGTKELTISAAIPKNGRYWLACVAQGAAGVVIRGGGVTSALPMSLGTSLPTDDDTFRPARTQSGVNGALPSTLTLASGPNSSRARIFLRYA